MKLHVLGPGFSTLVRSVRLYCEEKGLVYSYGMDIDGAAVAWRSEAHLACHPFAKVPVLLHGSTQVFETTAICRYIDAALSAGASTYDLQTRTLIDQWSSALVTSVDASLVRGYILPIAGPNRPAFTDRDKRARARLAAEETLAILDAQLGDQPFFCGKHYSMADALLSPMLDYLAQIAEPASLLDNQPRLMRYLGNMRKRPSGLAVLQNGGT